MSHNTFGHLFRVTTWGESHGPAIGCVIDGCPPLIPLTEADLQPWLDRRKPGGSRFVTQRQESDTAHILSGVFDDGHGPVTTGAPIDIQIVGNQLDQNRAVANALLAKLRGVRGLVEAGARGSARLECVDAATVGLDAHRAPQLLELRAARGDERSLVLGRGLGNGVGVLLRHVGCLEVHGKGPS